MNRLREAFVDLYVSTDRVRRRARRSEDQWELWMRRALLADRLGEHALAAQARQRAMRYATRNVRLQAFLEVQEDQIEAELAELRAALAR